MADQPGRVVQYKIGVKKQRFGVRCWVVIYIVTFFFNLAEKNLLLVKNVSLSVAKMASLVYE